MKGFFRMIEAFLALVLFFTVLSSIHLHNFPKYTDQANIPRMYDVAKRIALSYNGDRVSLARNELNPPDNSTLPEGIGYKIVLYSNSSGNALDVPVNWTGAEPPPGKEVVSYSLLFSGAAYNDTATGVWTVEYAPKRLVVMVWRE